MSESLPWEVDHDFEAPPGVPFCTRCGMSDEHECHAATHGAAPDAPVRPLPGPKEKP